MMKVKDLDLFQVAKLVNKLPASADIISIDLTNGIKFNLVYSDESVQRDQEEASLSVLRSIINNYNI